MFGGDDTGKAPQETLAQRGRGDRFVNSAGEDP
ncbi:Uncharacterised protein [Mycobacterium tuberculosis]|uniref:Uncharacterized protein n=1 Tax=Mycobacterium tuberculosis TaxID=1773 RepID=A0A916PG11_MYCTX|nr:Uncharacterised protein [Mycobacterium tuberculosis]COW34214.1 Uncharacterised protein [Mycobacterium tuberculosis]COW79566.1 Uncharacterised protein [Mycobacterium tuberculosis]COX04081.1 Uncharacterised protein [Mycobacterium tuberculosis]COZ93827.1 Uncharacterised protein [Mycobacterium tuberculosis]